MVNLKGCEKSINKVNLNCEGDILKIETCDKIKKLIEFISKYRNKIK